MFLKGTDFSLLVLQIYIDDIVLGCTCQTLGRKCSLMPWVWNEYFRWAKVYSKAIDSLEV